MKFNRSPLKIEGFFPKTHILQGVVWPVVGSKGDKYDVEMHPTGFTCTCTGFTMHGKCKHILAIHARITDDNYPKYRSY